jgi:predicted dehydrogenase
MEQVRWAVLGAGGIARRRTIPEGIIPADNAVLVAVCDPMCGAEVAGEFGVIHCETYEQLLEQDIDAVYIATPTFLHHDQVIQAAAAGKHALCEKPLAVDTNDAQGMIDACEKAGVKLGIGLMMRFHACHQAAKRLIGEGAIGKPVFGRAQLSCWYPPSEGAWRQDPKRGGGGCLADLGVHCIDLLEMFFGRTRRVMAMTGHVVHPYDSEDTATVLLEFEGGTCGVVDCLFNVPDNSSLNRLELYGSGGSILAEGTIGQGDPGTMTLRTSDPSAGYESQQQRDDAGGVAICPQQTNVYHAQVEAFSQSIINRIEPPVPGRDGLWSQRVLEACYQSAKTARAVEPGTT